MVRLDIMYPEGAGCEESVRTLSLNCALPVPTYYLKNVLMCGLGRSSGRGSGVGGKDLEPERAT